MKKRVGILVGVLAIAVITLLILIYPGKIQPEKEIKAYKIGFVGNLDGSIADSALLGGQIAVEELN